jgi:predicted metal-binding membrane protein
MPDSIPKRRVLATLLRRDRWIILSALAAMTLVTAVESQGMGTAMMRTPWPICVSSKSSWGLFELTTIVLMWGVMMVAMMTPAASPMVLAFAGLERQRIGSTGTVWQQTSSLLAGYLLVWMGFSVLATIVQWALYSAGVLSASGMRTANESVDVVVLAGAGLFQFSSLKSVCLKHCRTPIGFLISEWRLGLRGAFVMGIRHGLHCVGCCWLLMTLLYVVGVMNIAWGAALAALVLAERILPGGRWLGRVVGVILVLAAGGLVAGIV